MARRQILLVVLSIALCGSVNAQFGMFNSHPGLSKVPQQQQQHQPATGQAPPGGVEQPQPVQPTQPTQPKFNPQFRAFGSTPDVQPAPPAAASEAQQQQQHQAGNHASVPRANAGFVSPIKGLGNPNVTPQLPPAVRQWHGTHLAGPASGQCATVKPRSSSCAAAPAPAAGISGGG